MVYRITKRGGEEGEGDIRKQQDDPVMETRHDIIPLKFLRRAASDSRSERQRLSSSLIVIINNTSLHHFQTFFVPADGSL